MNSKKFVFLFVMALFQMAINNSFGQVNNVKLLDLTGNTYNTGTSFYINIGTQMQVTTDYTFEAWLYVDTKPSGASGYYPVIMDRRTVFSWFLIDDPSSTGSTYCLRFVARDNADGIIASVRSDGSSGSTHTPMNLQDWYHIAVSRDGTTLKLFINGTIVDQSNDVNFVLSTPTGNPVNYGARYWGSYQRFIDGALDECRYSDVSRYSINFSINTNSPPHDTTGDPNTILLFNFNHSNLDNATTANSYTAASHGTLSYADWDGFPTDKLPLPVTYLKELSGEVINENAIELSWVTASEMHNQGFEVQRSADGENWDSIGFIDGMGNSNVPHGYFFRDVKPLSGNYYRLKQMDWDGRITYSGIEWISLEQTSSLRIYPNPASGFIRIVGMNSSQIKKVELYNLTGKRMNDLILNSDNSIDISSLIKGIYFIKISTNDGEVFTKRFIKTR